MATPVVPNQFAVGKNKMVHKPTTATLNFDPGQTTFKSVDWGRAGEQPDSGLPKRRHHAGRPAAVDQAAPVDGNQLIE